jgi:predicted Fe-S protein YdhL (DUF1289 family)
VAEADLRGSPWILPEADPQVSPCTGVCVLDAAGSVCTGCARHAGEIAGWGAAPLAARAQVWAQLPARRAALRLPWHRLPWGPDRIGELIRRSLADRAGSWVLGIPGGLAEFSVGAEEPVELDASGPVVSAVTPRGAVRLAAPDAVRALTTAQPAAGPIVLVVPDNLRRAAPVVVTELGPDHGAICPTARGHLRFDLGLGSPAVRFCVRTDHPGLVDRLRAAEGRSWLELVAGHGPLLVEVSPDRVVETPLGRMEVATPIPPPGGRSPDGPHTHLLAGPLAEGGRTFGPVPLPAGWSPAATWYPAPPKEPA